MAPPKRVVEIGRITCKTKTRVHIGELAPAENTNHIDAPRRQTVRKVRKKLRAWTFLLSLFTEPALDSTRADAVP